MTDVAARPLAELDPVQLELMRLSVQGAELGHGALSLLELAKCAVWLHAVFFLTGFATGAGVATLDPRGALLIGAGGLVAAVLCGGGALWHRRRSVEAIARGAALQGAREDIERELERRGYGEFVSVRCRRVEP